MDDITVEINKAIQEKADSLTLNGYDRKGPLPKAILDIPSLRHLSLRLFCIDMPAWIADIASLESLEIEEAYGVSELLPSLWRLRNLRQLKLAYTWDLTALLLLLRSCKICKFLILMVLIFGYSQQLLPCFLRFAR